jgi:hypothetical protein
MAVVPGPVSLPPAVTVQAVITPMRPVPEVPVTSSNATQPIAAAVVSGLVSLPPAVTVQAVITPVPTAPQIPAPPSDVAQPAAAAVISDPEPLPTNIATIIKPYLAPRQADPSEPPEADLLFVQFADGS